MLLQNKSHIFGLAEKINCFEYSSYKNTRNLVHVYPRRNLWGRNSYPFILNVDTRWDEGLASRLGHFTPYEVSFMRSDIKCTFLYRTWFWTVWQPFKEMNIDTFWSIKKSSTGYKKVKPIQVSLLRFIIPQMLNIYIYSSTIDSESI